MAIKIIPTSWGVVWIECDYVFNTYNIVLGIYQMPPYGVLYIISSHLQMLLTATQPH